MNRKSRPAGPSARKVRALKPVEASRAAPRGTAKSIETSSSAPYMSQTDAAVDLIRSRIIGLNLEPGSRIDEPLLIKTFKLGRTPAREAINRLVAEGFVNIVPNRGGTYVRKLDLREIGEIVVAHQLAETVLGQLCQLEDPTLADDLEGMHQKYIVEVEKRSFLNITAINEEFHLRMHKSIGNTFFFEFARSTHRHVRRLLVFLYKLEEAEPNYLREQFDLNVKQHEAIIEAIRKRDRDFLRDFMPKHARFTQQRLMRLLEGKAIEPFSLNLWSGPAPT